MCACCFKALNVAHYNSSSMMLVLCIYVLWQGKDKIKIEKAQKEKKTKKEQ